MTAAGPTAPEERLYPHSVLPEPPPTALVFIRSDGVASWRITQRTSVAMTPICRWYGSIGATWQG